MGFLITATGAPEQTYLKVLKGSFWQTPLIAVLKCGRATLTLGLLPEGMLLVFSLNKKTVA